MSSIFYMLQEIFEDIKAVIGSRKYNTQKNNKIKTKNQITKQKLDRKKVTPPPLPINWGKSN